MRSFDRPRNVDEWPNLSEIEAPARFQDGEPIGPLSSEPTQWALLITVLLAALMVCFFAAFAMPLD